MFCLLCANFYSFYDSWIKMRHSSFKKVPINYKIILSVTRRKKNLNWNIIIAQNNNKVASWRRMRILYLIVLKELTTRETNIFILKLLYEQECCTNLQYNFLIAAILNRGYAKVQIISINLVWFLMKIWYRCT